MIPPDGNEAPFWKRHFRSILWGIAIAGVIVSIATRFKFVFFFLPLVFAPSLFRNRGDDEEGQ